jgi:branched-chain amino acid transport system ATP-binding protein
VLDVKSLTMDFGGIRALDGVDLDVNAGEIVALIGPNGAGKTTFFNCITGIYTPTSGDVLVTPGASTATSPTRSPSWAWPAPSRTSGSSPP